MTRTVFALSLYKYDRQVDLKNSLKRFGNEMHTMEVLSVYIISMDGEPPQPELIFWIHPIIQHVKH